MMEVRRAPASLLSHPRLAALARALATRTPTLAAATADVRRAAVAVILRPDEEGELDLLCIQRAVYPGDPWSGQVALPGGRWEPGDASLAETAVRETREETAVDLARDGLLLGALDELHPRTPALPPIVVRPHVFAVAPRVTVLPTAEVADAFWVPLATLRDPATSVESSVEVRGTRLQVPSFRLGERVVWGMTERMLRDLLALAF